VRDAAVVLLLIWWKGEPRDPKWRRWALLGTIPFFVLGLALAYVTIHMERSFVRAEGADWDLLWTQRILIAGRAIWFYARKILVPVNLTFIYPRWNVEAGQLVQWLYPIAVIAVLAVLFALRKRIGRGPIAAALIFCGTLVPALGFFQRLSHALLVRGGSLPVPRGSGADHGGGGGRGEGAGADAAADERDMRTAPDAVRAQRGRAGGC
jgi:hypothetical protein